MFQDPKYEFRDGRLWHRQGKYWVPSDEPVMVLRAKDPDTIKAIEAYVAHTASVEGDQEAADHNSSSIERLEAFRKFQSENPSRVKRGCHKCD